ncbi:MAG TPA: hypothetical protein DGT23_10245, partial [Micromonosporaceae bacterium]|nr:hypothetical protein [Micromonosporaceae bacterium]
MCSSDLVRVAPAIGYCVSVAVTVIGTAAPSQSCVSTNLVSPGSVADSSAAAEAALPISWHCAS